MVEAFLLTVVGGVVACAAWDWLKAVLRKMC